MTFNLRYFKKVILAFAILFLSWFFIHSVYITVDGFRDNEKKGDIAVVFGNKINEDGTPSTRLQARLDQAIYLYKEGRVNTILVSGGLGKEGFWEGAEMQNYLIQAHIPPKAILVDNDGDNTEKRS